VSKRKNKTKDKKNGGETPHLLPLHLEMVGCATQEEMNSNVEATIERGYTALNASLDAYDGDVSIVGSGPSIQFTFDDLTGDVMAINSAIGYLLDQDIVPKFGMIWDADEICKNFAVPHPDITYLIGSRCHPKVFERLKDCEIIVWHAGGDHNINELMVEKGLLEEPMVNGGSAGVTRAMYLAVGLGYKPLHIFGADSCYRENATHINGSLVPEKDLMVAIGNDPPLFFRTTPEWCSQVNEFRDIYSIFSHPKVNIDISVYGEGMLPHMASLMEEKKEKGFLWNEDGSMHESNVPTEMEPHNIAAKESQLLEEKENDTVSQ